MHICCRLNLISSQNDFNLGWSIISLSLGFIIIHRDKEIIANQPRLKSFWPEIKFNLQHIHPGLKLSLNIISMYVRKMPNIQHVHSFYQHCNISPQIIPVISLDVSLCLCWMAIWKMLDRLAAVVMWVN